MRFNELPEGGVFDELPGERQKVAYAFRRPAGIESVRPRFQRYDGLECVGVSHVDGHAHASIVRHPTSRSKLAGQFDCWMVAVTAKLFLHIGSVGLHSGLVVFRVPGESKQDAEQLHTRVNQDA